MENLQITNGKDFSNPCYVVKFQPKQGEMILMFNESTK